MKASAEHGLPFNVRTSFIFQEGDKVMAAEKATIDQLRDDIDRGRTGDKVSFSDPAAAPLGTDEEAAGTPLNATLVGMVRERELAKVSERLEAEAEPPVGSQYPGRGVNPALAFVAAIFALLALVWYYSS